MRSGGKKEAIIGRQCEHVSFFIYIQNIYIFLQHYMPEHSGGLAESSPQGIFPGGWAQVSEMSYYVLSVCLSGKT